MYTKGSEDTCKLNAWCADKKTLHEHDLVNLVSMHESDIVLNKHVWVNMTTVLLLCESEELLPLYVNNM